MKSNMSLWVNNNIHDSNITALLKQGLFENVSCLINFVLISLWTWQYIASAVKII